MHIITGKDKLNIMLNKYGQLMYGKKVSIYLLCLILMSMSSYKPNLNCLSSGVLPYMCSESWGDGGRGVSKSTHDAPDIPMLDQNDISH